MTVLRDLLKIQSFREKCVSTRLKYFLAKRRLKTLNESAVSYSVTVKHNLKGLRSCDIRMLDIMMPLFASESFRPNGNTLIIGPRNEHDLFLYASLGGAWSNVRGVDLISYSPKIDLGDMHRLPYESNSYDAIICGWTLSYSKQPQKAIDEMLRLLKPGGMIALGVEYSNMTPDDSRTLRKLLDGDDYDLGFDDTGKRILNSTHDLTSMLPADCEIIFQHDAPLKLSHGPHGFVPKPSRVAIVARIPV
jgi:SAM-dependent methyltransferase